MNASIGQGYVLANPLQLAVMAARIASGRAIVPRLLLRPAARRSPSRSASIPSISRIVRDAMFAVVNDGGTGGAARMQVPGVALAAKTGTAQVRRITMAERASGVLNNGSLPFKLRDHALFVCFAPADNPRYAAAVVLEHNGHTVRNLDTPMIGRDIMTYLFDRDRAMASLAEVEPTWGGDIKTRMAAQADGVPRGAGAAPSPRRQPRKPSRPLPPRHARSKPPRAARRRRRRDRQRRSTGNTVASDTADRAAAMSADVKTSSHSGGFVPEPLAQLPWLLILLVARDRRRSGWSCCIRPPAGTCSPGR